MAEEPADRRLIAARVCAELNSSGAKYLVIGGFACALHGYVRATTDVDILIDLEPVRSLLEIVAIKQDLEDLLGCSVDVVTEAAVSPYIREQVLSEAVRL